MNLKYKKIDNIRDLVTLCYSEDEEMIETYHVIAGSSLHDCIEDTVNVLEKDGESFYQVELNGDIVGYFGDTFKFVPYLTTFFIRNKFRNKDVFSEFWNLIKKHFDNRIFFTGLYCKNTRAIKHIQKYGGELFERIKQNNKDGYVFIFNKE
jgi:hypothetical protein